MDKQKPNQYKNKSSSIKTFFEKIPDKQKGTDTIEAKSKIQESTGGKGKGKEVRWGRDLDRACSTKFWRRRAGQNMGSTWVEEYEREYVGGGTWDHLKKNHPRVFQMPKILG